MRALFKTRNYRLLFAGNLVSQIGSALYNFGISWFILSFTGSTLQAGIYLGFAGIFQILLVPFLSVYADRWHKGKILVITDGIRGVVILAAGAILWQYQSPEIVLPTLYITAFVIAVNHALFTPAVSAIIPEIVPDTLLQQAYSVNSFINSIQQLVGVLLAGVLYSLLGIVGIFVVNGVSFILSAISELWIRLDHTSHTSDKSVAQYFRDLSGGIRYVTDKDGLVGMFMLIILLNFAVAPIFSNIHPYVFNLVLNKPPIHLSLVSVAFSIGAILGGLLVGTIGLKASIKRSMRMGLISFYALLMVHHALIVLVVLDRIEYAVFLMSILAIAFVIAIANMWINIPFNTGLTRAVDAAYRGRVMGLISTLAQGLIPVAIFMTGLLLELLTLPVVLLIFAGIGLLPVLLFVRSKSVNQLLESLKNAPA